VKVEALDYGDRKVYTVAAFNQGVATWLARLPSVWVEGEVTGLRRHAAWASVFFTLKDPESGACLAAQMPRGQFDALRLDLADGERVHVYGRPTFFEARGELRLRVLTIERFGIGAHLAALARLKEKLAAEGLFAAERKRPLPFLPRRIGLVTGNDAAAKRDVVTAVTTRFPPAHLVVAETLVQGPRAAQGLVDALDRICRAGAEVVILARGGGSFEDLLAFSDERLVRAVAACPVPVVSAVGHEQDTPLCDLAADVRASTPTAAARLVVPDLGELVASLDRARAGLERGARRAVERHGERLALLHAGLERGARRTVERHETRLGALKERLRRAPTLALERRRHAVEHTAARLRALSPSATLERGYAIVRSDGVVTAPPPPGTSLQIDVAGGTFGAVSE
jgi:exodeoxyribonuclease VII large subunit